MELGATWYPGLDLRPGHRDGRRLRAGRHRLHQRPLSAAIVATHAPDTHLWKPIFHEGEIVAFTGGHIHNTDMGGAVPASPVARADRDPPGGHPLPADEARRARRSSTSRSCEIMTTNVRKPDLNVGDIKALVGALNTGERKVLAMIEKFGVDAFLEGVSGAARLRRDAGARRCCASIPDGDYCFADYADEDGPSTANPCRLVRDADASAATRRCSTSPAPTRSSPRRSTCRPAAIRGTRCCWSASTTSSTRCNPSIVLNTGPDAALHLHRAGRHGAEPGVPGGGRHALASPARGCAR